MISLDALINDKHGLPGEGTRDKFNDKSINYRLGIKLKELRKKSGLTQEQLAIKSRTKKSYISRVESGQIDIQIGTLNRIIELGLNKKIFILFTEIEDVMI